MSEAKKLFRELLRSEVCSKPFNLDDWLLDSCQRVLSKPSDLAASYVQANGLRIFNDFGRFNDELLRRGRRSAFRILDAERRIITNSITIGEVNNLRRRRLDFRCEVLRWVDTLNDREFEFLGAVVSEFFGAQKVHVTPKGNEGGVDFYALVPVMGRSDILHGQNRELRIVGQSKLYRGAVQADKVREFSDVLDTIRKRGRYMEGRIPDWFDDHDGPIVGWIIGANGFQSAAWTLARERGIILSDERDIADNVLMYRGFPAVLSSGTVEPILKSRLSDAIVKYG